MSRYPLVPLRDFLILQQDEVPVDAGETYRTAGIYSFGRGLFARPPFPGSGTTYRSLFRLKEGRFVYSRLFAWEGALAVVGPGSDGLYVSHEFPTFDIDEGRAHPEFVAWLCRWPALWESAASGTRGLGLRRQRVHPEQLLAVTVPLPTISEQKRLVAQLESIAELAKRAAAMRQEVSALIAATLHAELAPSHGYPLVPLGSFLMPAADETAVQIDQTYPIAGIYSFGRGLFPRPPMLGSETKYSTLFRLRSGQFVYSRLKAFEGAVAVVDPAISGAFVSQEYPTFDIDPDRAERGFFQWLCRWPRFWELLAAQSKGIGARRERVHPEQLLADVKVPLPPLDQQRRLSRSLDSVAELSDLAATFQEEADALIPATLTAALLST